ncbi:aldo/keto reductase [Frigidibacter albus]|uniref:Aldo/keto reductase n=1 Tax=Frigidibacter albus TaxID=1465486 RepID=A0A6L8VK55_9RHOB|nr:aldo/keto reductase [Frigidibacter albus]MZQ90755.1 aldo/keto reductase [Frigidibacter albus]NBE32627.1 aldo/keto reductase [Frigidibacter albus]GGH61002.1 oxidoreductase [Frigidibacter albus]
MQKRELGAGGPMVSAIGLGCMSFAGAFGPTTEAESHACLDAALAAGMDFLDTANVYGMGVSETVIGRWLASRRPEVVIATKAAIVNGTPRSFDNSEAHLRSELEGSLRRLGREQVELFYIHRRDIRVPLEDVVGTLARLIEEGKIGGYGLSEVAPSTLRRAHAVHPCRAVQNEYSLWSRQPELGVIRACKELGVAFVPFSPVARGMMGDTALRLDQVQDGFRARNPRFMEPNFSANTAIIDGLRAYARARGVPTAQLALAWVLAQGPHLIPIPGTRSAAHLRDLAGAGELELTPEDFAEIDRLLPAGFAHGDRYSDDQIRGVERYC